MTKQWMDRGLLVADHVFEPLTMLDLENGHGRQHWLSEDVRTPEALDKTHDLIQGQFELST
jgi:hypothetical protein